MGIIIGIDNGTGYIPKCGYKKSDGSIIMCDECMFKMQNCHSELKIQKEIMELINKNRMFMDSSCYSKLKLKIEG